MVVTATLSETPTSKLYLAEGPDQSRRPTSIYGYTSAHFLQFFGTHV